MKKNMFFAAGIFAAASFALPQLASASLIYDASINVSGLGFGSAPRDLTLQAPNNTTIESGGVGVSSTGQIVFGQVINDAAVFDGNGVTNSSSLASMPPPLTASGNKYGIPTTGSLSITTANQIAILFNASEPSGNFVNVTDLTLKFFNSTGLLLGAIDGSQDFGLTLPGNGSAGYTFIVSLDEQAFVNSLLAIGGAGTTLALESTITNAFGGPESFLIYNRAIGNPNPPSAVPEPTTIALLGLGLLGFAASRRKSGKSNNA